MLRITTVQAHLFWEDREANFRHLETLLAPLRETDLIILPEMFSSGFSMNSEKLAEQMDGATVKWLQSIASEKNAVITGSFIAVENGNYYNRLIWVQPDGNFHVYDKRHLFSLAGEDKFYTPGKKRLEVEWKGWKICPLICYDLRFPVWSRNDTAFDVLIYVANWPRPRIQAWNTLLTARAIENQCFTIGVNRVGNDAVGNEYSGNSCITDFAGNTLYKAAEVEDVFTITLEKEGLLDFRQKLPFLNDRDDFSIISA